MLSNIQLLQCLLLIVGTATLDRLIGWGGFGRSKPIIAALAFFAAIGHWVHLTAVSSVTFAIAFCIWRTPGWHVLGGSINPDPKHAIGTFARHALSLFFLLPAYWAGLKVLPVSAAMLGFTCAATALGVYNYFTLAKKNDIVETVRGALLGAALAAGYIVLQ